MKLWLVFTSLFLYTNMSSSQVTAEIKGRNPAVDTLEFVQVVFRHGDREPETIPEGSALLTNLGKKQMFDLGRLLRHRYSHLIQSIYDPSELFIVSSSFGRAIQSGSCVALGLYQDFNLAANWSGDVHISFEPIPVQTIPEGLDNILYVDAPCPKRDNIFLKRMADLSDAFIRENPDLFEYYRKNNGDPGVFDRCSSNLERFLVINEAQEKFFYSIAHNESLPDWTLPLFKMNAFSYPTSKRILHVQQSDPEFTKLFSGPFIQLLINNFQRKMGGQGNTRVIAYSGHDRNLASLLKAVGLTARKYTLEEDSFFSPDYGAALVIELHKNRQIDGYFLRFWYRNNSTEDLEAFVIPECGDPCDLEQFTQIVQKMIPAEFDKECQLTPDLSVLGSFQVGAVFILLLSSLIVITIFVIPLLRRKVTRNPYEKLV